MDQRRWKAEAARKKPRAGTPRHKEIVTAAAIEPGMRVLDLACGLGGVGILARARGAEVIELDIWPDLARVAAANADGPAVCASMTALPFRSGSFDRVLGAAALHHLSPADVRIAVSEARRVLRPAGAALFLEPVENSKVFDIVQNVFPKTARRHRRPRPSILQRRKWRAYVASMDDRGMTDAELLAAAPGARILGYRGFLRRVLHGEFIELLDALLTHRWSPIRHLAQTAIVTYPPPT